MDSKHCPTCGATTVEYRHNLGRPLIEALKKLYMSGGINHLSVIGLTHSQYNNFQKLKYWGLVEETIDDSGAHVNGSWSITPIGQDFIAGRITIQKIARTYRGKTVAMEGNFLSFLQAERGYRGFKTRQEYNADAVAH